MGRLGRSTKAVLIATIAIIAIGFIFSAIQPIYELKMLSVMNDGPLPAEQAVEILFWPVLVFVVLATVVTFGVGGYLAGRLAGYRARQHAALAATIPLVMAWSFILSEQDAALLRPILVTVIGMVVAMSLSVYGERTATDR